MINRVQKGEINIPLEKHQLISMRYHTITKAINREFWLSNSDTNHSFYVGSYGRNTAINTSDIDILVELPNEQFYRFNNISGNNQSRLLQAVRTAILASYPRSDVRADGQVVKINFSDDIYFEIIPAFYYDNKYTYPDSNMGGNWKSTNPKAEQFAMSMKNKNSNGLLNDTCRHIRFIRDTNFASYKLSGIVIDSFVYNAIGNWHWVNEGEYVTNLIETYEDYLLKLYENNYMHRNYVYAPGSNDYVNIESSAKCLHKVLKYIALKY